MSNYPPTGAPQAAYPPPQYSPPPQPSGCGCGGCLGKFFIFLGVVFFGLIVLCCGGGYWLIKTSITTKPLEAGAIQEEIASLRVPQPLAPVFAARLKAPLSGTFLGEEVIYATPDRKAIMTLTCFSDAFGAQFKTMLKKSMESAQPQPVSTDNDQEEELKDSKETTVERTIRGESARFYIVEGVGVKTGAKRIRVHGEFQGKNGPTILAINADESVLSRQQVDDIIKSIDEGTNGAKK